MKYKSYKLIITFVTICFFGTAFAQKFDKKFSENFRVKKDVVIAINATNTEINVTTWNKNEVEVKAFIEIEGLSEKEAEKYFKNWNFEALGNSRKVEVTSKGAISSIMNKNDFIFFDNMNFDFNIPEIQMPNFDAIVIPDFDFDFDFDFESLEDLEENMEKSGVYSFEIHTDDEDIVIKTKKEWETFKKSNRYKKLKKSIKNEGVKVKIIIEKLKNQINSKQLKASLKQAQLKLKNINTKEIQEGLLKAQKALKNMTFKFGENLNDLSIDGKKIKVTKRLEIKVPKNATFNLNTRHCKVKLPNTVASGNVKYGSLYINNLIGGKLTVDYSKVNINDLTACTLFLNNVTDAKIASVTNTNMSNNSSDLTILKINDKVNLTDKFGKLVIESFHPNFGEFVLNLSRSDATLIFGDVPSKFKYQVNRVKLDNKKVTQPNNKYSKNLCKVLGEYSSIVIK